MADHYSKGSRVQEILRQLRPFLGQQVDEVYKAYLSEGAEGKEQMETYLEALLAQRLGSPVEQEFSPLVPPRPEETEGPYHLGQVLFAGGEYAPFGLRESEWIQHVGIFGRSGAGKTNAGYLVVRELQRHGKPFLVLDWKRNYRDLITQPGFDGVEVYTIGRPIAPLNFNPLVPPPERHNTQHNRSADTEVHSITKS